MLQQVGAYNFSDRGACLVSSCNVRFGSKAVTRLLASALFAIAAVPDAHAEGIRHALLKAISQ
jgi:hypothetical protein